jgi:hypothetical protein
MRAGVAYERDPRATPVVKKASGFYTKRRDLTIASQLQFDYESEFGTT